MVRGCRIIRSPAVYCSSALLLKKRVAVKLSISDCGLLMFDLFAEGEFESPWGYLQNGRVVSRLIFRSLDSLNSHARYDRLKYNTASNNSLHSGFNPAGACGVPVFCNMAK